MNVRTGDVWALGPHRLMCGDAYDVEMAAVFLASVWGREVTPGQVRKLAHRHGWRRRYVGHSVLYEPSDVESTPRPRRYRRQALANPGPDLEHSEP